MSLATETGAKSPRLVATSPLLGGDERQRRDRAVPLVKSIVRARTRWNVRAHRLHSMGNGAGWKRIVWNPRLENIAVEDAQFAFQHNAVFGPAVRLHFGIQVTASDGDDGLHELDIVVRAGRQTLPENPCSS
jgi:hypothetical protein